MNTFLFLTFTRYAPSSGHQAAGLYKKRYRKLQRDGEKMGVQMS